MANGGYQIISLKNKNLIPGGDSVVIKGLYSALESNHHKPVIVEDIVVSGVERNSKWANFGIEEGNFHAELGIDEDDNVLHIEITPDDEVQLTIF